MATRARCGRSLQSLDRLRALRQTLEAHPEHSSTGTAIGTAALPIGIAAPPIGIAVAAIGAAGIGIGVIGTAIGAVDIFATELFSLVGLATHSDIRCTILI